MKAKDKLGEDGHLERGLITSSKGSLETIGGAVGAVSTVGVGDLVVISCAGVEVGENDVIVPGSRANS